MIIISDLEHLEDVSNSSNVVGSGIILINQVSIAFAEATTFNGDATAIANAESNFTFWQPSKRL